jgi:hypothetical protein
MSCAGHYFFDDVLARFGRPGLAPAGELLSFASPKERKQRKGEPTVCVPQQSCGQPAVLASGGVSLELGYRLKQSRTLIPLKLRSSAQTEGRWTAQLPQLPRLPLSLQFSLSALFLPLRQQPQPTQPVTLGGTLLGTCTCDWSRAKNFLGKRLFSPARAKQSAVGIAAVETGLSSAAAGGSGLALFEAIAEFSQTPPDASSARHREAARPSARFFFGYLLLARQKKVTRPPGRDPAYPNSTCTREY